MLKLIVPELWFNAYHTITTRFTWDWEMELESKLEWPTSKLHGGAQPWLRTRSTSSLTARAYRRAFSYRFQDKDFCIGGGSGRCGECGNRSVVEREFRAVEVWLAQPYSEETSVAIAKSRCSVIYSRILIRLCDKAAVCCAMHFVVPVFRYPIEIQVALEFACLIINSFTVHRLNLSSREWHWDATKHHGNRHSDSRILSTPTVPFCRGIALWMPPQFLSLWQPKRLLSMKCI